MVKAFEMGEDVYKMMASSIYNKRIDQITDEERFVGKTTILGAGYGMGAVKFQLQLKIVLILMLLLVMLMLKFLLFFLIFLLFF